MPVSPLRRALVLGLAAALTSGPFVLAHEGASGVVKQRMQLMEGMGDAIKPLAAMFKGERPYDAEAVKAAATRLRDHAGEKITELFPEDSIEGPSEARPEIWERWDAFERLAAQLEAYGGALVEAADNPRAGDMAGGGNMMMDGGGGMMGGGQGMMMDGGGGPDPAAVAAMPPAAAFAQVTRTCNACHTAFRVEK